MTELTTVSVPPGVREIFLRAQDYVARYFGNRTEDPTHSTISISGERYILVRAASMSIEFFDLVSSLYQDQGVDEARTVANNLLYDVAHAIGKADARQFHQRMGVTDPIERLSAGPVHFAFAGWAFVSIDPSSRPSPDDGYYLLYDHPFSFESDAWIRRGRRVEFPVCIMNAGYSSGWCEESFGLPLVAAEVECMACGDPVCRFIMAPPHRIEGHLDAYRAANPHRGPRPAWPGQSGSPPVAVPEFFQRKRMEQELRASHDMLEERVRERTAELERAVEALEREMAERRRAEAERQGLEQQFLQAQKLESLGVMAGGIAHDFNNLLVGVLGNASLALSELPGDDPVVPTLQSIENAARRAAELTRQMLSYAGRAVFELRPVDLSVLVREMADLLRTVISKRATLAFDFTPDLPPASGDATQLRQVVMNLIVNASDALEDRPGEIVLSTSIRHADRPYLAGAYLDEDLPEGEYVVLRVSDTGKGMDDETVRRMFDPFFSTKFVGRGLGLAAVLGIVRSHRGAIRVESTPGGGTVVTLLLPVSPLPLPPPSPTPETPAPAVTGGPALVLIIDDEATVATVSARILAGAGFRCLTAARGAEGIGILAGDPGAVTAVLLDATMPDLPGEEVLRRLREIRPDLPVVVSSGHGEAEVMQRFKGQSVQAFLQKPYLSNHLAGALREAIRSSK